MKERETEGSQGVSDKRRGERVRARDRERERERERERAVLHARVTLPCL